MSLPSTIKESLEYIISIAKQARDNDGNLLFNTVAVWNDQLKRAMDGSGYSYLHPAFFVEVQEVGSEALGLGTVNQDLQIILHILHEELDAMDGSLDQNLNVFDWRSYVRRSFIGLDVPNMNTLMYHKEYEDYKHNNIYHFRVVLKTKYWDRMGNPYVNGVYQRIASGTWTINSTEEYVPSTNDL